MTIDTWLKATTERLQKAGIETARLDALVLLEDVLEGLADKPVYTNRAHLLAHGDEELSAQSAKQVDVLVTLRAKHEPLAYIRGKVEFYGREFMVGPAVLVPRPESETIIDLFKEFVQNEGTFVPVDNPQGPVESLTQVVTDHPEDHRGPTQPVLAPHGAQTAKKHLTRQPAAGWRVADIGTGSGILGITAALEVSATSVDLLEIDPEALKVAKRNMTAHGLHLAALVSDLLDKAEHPYDILLCNLPYVPEGYYINKAARHEPELALFAGPDGLELYRALFDQIDGLEAPQKPLLLLCESLPSQHDVLLYRAQASGYTLAREVDFIQAFTRK